MGDFRGILGESIVWVSLWFYAAGNINEENGNAGVGLISEVLGKVFPHRWSRASTR